MQSTKRYFCSRSAKSSSIVFLLITIELYFDEYLIGKNLNAALAHK